MNAPGTAHPVPAETRLATDVLVVGAGICGLTAGARLVAGGVNVLVVDKGRGVGGRCATRRWGALRADHGAQFFTASDPEFVRQTESWLERGVCALWTHRLHRWGAATGVVAGEGARARYVAREGMSALAKDLAASVPARSGVTISHIDQTANGWRVLAHEGVQIDARRVVLTPPAPQTAALLGSSGLGIPARLSAMTFEPCIAVVVRGAPGPAPEWAGIDLEDHPVLRWIGDDRSRRGQGAAGGPVFVLHATGEFSNSWVDRDLDAAADRILGCAQEILPEVFGRIEERFVHRWRFARPSIRPAPSAGLVEPLAAGLWAAGDAFGGARIEGAFCSGAAIARQLASGD
jgi:renalase